MLALDQAGGRLRAVDTEDVAVIAHRLAPGAFSWRKHPDQIDLDSTRVSLTDACKAKYGRLVTGSVRSGWILTQAGVAWADGPGRAVRESLMIPVLSARSDVRLEHQHEVRELRRLRSSDGFRIWEAGEPVPDRVAAAAFRVDRYTTIIDRHAKVNRLYELARMDNDDAVARFILAVSAAVLGFGGQQ